MKRVREWRRRFLATTEKAHPEFKQDLETQLGFEKDVLGKLGPFAREWATYPVIKWYIHYCINIDTYPSLPPYDLVKNHQLGKHKVCATCFRPCKKKTTCHGQKNRWMINELGAMSRSGPEFLIYGSIWSKLATFKVRDNIIALGLDSAADDEGREIPWRSEMDYNPALEVPEGVLNSLEQAYTWRAENLPLSNPPVTKPGRSFDNGDNNNNYVLMVQLDDLKQGRKAMSVQLRSAERSTARAKSQAEELARQLEAEKQERIRLALEVHALRAEKARSIAAGAMGTGQRGERPEEVLRRMYGEKKSMGTQTDI